MRFVFVETLRRRKKHFIARHLSRVARQFLFESKIPTWVNFGGSMEHVCIFYDHLVNFPAICHILWPFGIFSPVLVHFTRFGKLYQEKSGNPASLSPGIHENI
jgi:hypothetical protein